MLITKPQMVPFAASLYGLILLPALLASAVAVYVAWRIRPSRHRGWLTATLTVLAMQAVAIAVIELSATGRAHQSAPGTAQQSWSRLSDLLVVVVVVGCCAVGAHADLRPDPFSVGLIAGTALAAVRVATVTLLPEMPIGPRALAFLEFCFLAVVFVAALAVGRQHGLRRDIRIQLVVAGAMIGTAQYAAAYLPGGESSAVAVLLLEGVGGVLVTHAALGMLRRTVTADRRNLAELEERFWRAEQGARLSRAQLHEVNATLAGISSASRLIRDGLTSDERRRRLEEMMDLELARLGRLLAGEPGGAEYAVRAARVAVDDLLDTLVTAHEARGHAVRWTPTGAELVGRRDDVHEVLSILLDNAAKHGGDGATVTLTEHDRVVEIEVHDDGPGVIPGVDVFAWGQRGPRSEGQGIGLHIARELMENQGGYLRLRPTAGPGATFVVGLPAAASIGRERVGDAGARR